ncbi:hypothetical protein U5801_00865 [Lamprobacter modestohalophilus]|uniref:hypothetical protein n=1 Tax=Lamprobacter modestohalophilus TaxID=1064514 RepID=UPI002ADEC687|nr:hypothetical protein [Lamprobacter modestohalophilus]MEA1048374.1 hypothetical protein [Lamprobacter modestohalophilus]
MSRRESIIVISFILFSSAACVSNPIQSKNEIVRDKVNSTDQSELDSFIKSCKRPSSFSAGSGSVSGVYYNGTEAVDFGSADGGSGSIWWYTFSVSYDDFLNHHPELTKEIILKNGTRSLTHDPNGSNAAAIECSIEVEELDPM